MTTETTVETAVKSKAWAADPGNPPGPIQLKRFNDALGKVKWEHNTFEEKTGIVGVSESSHFFTVLFGVNCREDVVKVQQELGEKYNWMVSRANVVAIVADIEAALPALQKNRPVKDSRITPEAESARVAELQAEQSARDARTERLKGTAPEFQATMGRLSNACGRTVDWVYKLWSEYSLACSNSDQSPVLVEFVTNYHGKLGGSPNRLVAALEAPPVAPTTAKPSSGALGTVRRNLEHDGVEISFTDKPTDELRSRLKYAGFRITRRPPWKWYAKFSATMWAKAIELAGVDPVSAPTPASEESHDGGMVQAQENAFQDAQCAMIGA